MILFLVWSSGNFEDEVKGGGGELVCVILSVYCECVSCEWGWARCWVVGICWDVR